MRNIFVNSGILLFQSTLPRGSDRKAGLAKDVIDEFQSTLPRGSDRNQLLFNPERMIFQSTLPRGSDKIAAGAVTADKIISIHAPSRERHKASLNLFTAKINFNPRSLAGATLPVVQVINPHCNFNPRSLAGATSQTHWQTDCLRRFQSTLPRGSDSRCGLSSESESTNFNPRSLAGATLIQHVIL